MLDKTMHIARRTRVRIFGLVLLCALSGHAAAEIIDDISLSTDARGEIDANIEFTVPVQYVRHFPMRNSSDVAIYFNILGSVPSSEWQNYESHRSPPSQHILGFTVSTRDLNTGPRIVVRFRQPAEFSVRAGKTDRSILIHIKPGPVQPKRDEGKATTQPGRAAPAPVVPPAVVPGIVRPAPVAPSTAPVRPPAARPAAPAPQAPAVQIGGKDGLPLFPAIDPVPAQAPASAPPGTLTLAEQIKRTDSQAAFMMAQGRDALLAGEMFAAIEAFNQVLNLPPNKYSADAQIWMGIARERTGQIAKAKLEFELYLKLYPAGKEVRWVRERLSILARVQPAVPAAKPAAVAARTQRTEFQTSTYGSLSTYYYHGASQTDTVAFIGGTPTPTTLSLTDQSSLINNVSLTARSFNDEFDNRLVLQDFYSVSFLPGQPDRNRLNAAYYDVKNRILNYSARIGRQSAFGGGVLGRFDGLSAGYGFLPDWRANIAVGRMSDVTLDSPPSFYSVSVDFGVNEALGGSVYVINQKIGGITDRTATGGYLRYLEQGSTAMAMLDYDTQFKQVNILTVQGTLHQESGIDYNFLVDRRKTPTLGIMNAVNGATYTQGIPNLDPVTGDPIPDSFTFVSAPSTIADLLQNGWTQQDLVDLARKRTADSNLLLLGVTKRIQEKWQIGSDISVTNTSGLPESGTDLGNGITGREGYFAPTASSGNAWAISGRVSGSDVLFARDTSMTSLSYSKSNFAHGTSLLLYNRAPLREQWTLDTTLRLFRQSDTAGGTSSTTSPELKLSYALRNNLTLEADGGIDWTKTTSAAAPDAKTTRQYFSLGFRWDF